MVTGLPIIGEQCALLKQNGAHTSLCSVNYVYDLTVCSLVRVFCVYIQAAVYCTPGKAKKAVVGLTLLPLIIQIVRFTAFSYVPQNNISTFNAAVFLVLPLAVLVINVIVMCEMRRAANAATAMLQHHQSTSSSSPVPTVMLIATSLIYVVLCGPSSALQLIMLWVDRNRMARSVSFFALFVAQRLIFVYNFFVYLITGKQFRAELRTICCCCVPTAATATAAAAAAGAPRHGQLVTSSV